MRFIATPLAPSVETPGPRPGGLASPALRGALLAVPGTEAALARLESPDALAVTSGQQPALFGGPLYTVYKALAAAALADQLEQQWGRPVVPVFWLANDDHDFAEAREASWLDAAGTLVRRGLAERPADAPLTPMSGLIMGPELEEILTHFESGVRDFPHGHAAVAWLGRHFVPGRTLGAAFGGALAELLAPFGIVCFDSSHPAAKAAMATLLLGALRRAEDLDRRLEARARALAAAGTPSPVSVGEGAAVVFLEGEAGRDRLIIAPGGFTTRRSGSFHTLAELSAIATHEPSRLSPNVLLRPVVESALLPTVAYVAGPGELAYLPAAQPLYDALEVTRQPPVPRWSGVLVEPRVDRVLRKFDASLEELLRDDEAVERRHIQGALPAELVDAAEHLRRAIETEYDRIRQGATDIDPTLERPIGRLRHEAIAGVDRAVGKIERHLRRRVLTELEQIARARTSVRPGGRPQERVLGVPGFLARYGPGFLEEASAVIREWYSRTLVATPARP